MMLAGSTGPIVGAAIARRRRKIFVAFRTLSATSPDSARTLFELGITTSRLFRTQLRRKVIVQLEGDKYYLDEYREKDAERLRHRIAFGMIAALLAFLFIALLLR